MRTLPIGWRLARRSWWLLLPALLAIAIAACSSSGSGTPATPSSPSPQAQTPALATATIPPPPPAATSAPAPTSITSVPPDPATPVQPVEKATVVYRGDATKRMVALTFDAGSDAGYTAQILETLRAEGVRASFGVTGKWAEQNHDLLLAIAAGGHEFINHTYDHASFTGLSTGQVPLSTEQRTLEISRTETTIYHLTGRSTRPYFRPPYGDLDESVRADVARGGYPTIVMWTVDTLGWKGATPDEIVQRSLAQAAPGAIYVMHVGSQSQDGVALQRVIDGLRAAGYSFGAVSEVIG